MNGLRRNGDAMKRLAGTGKNGLVFFEVFLHYFTFFNGYL